MSQNCAAESRKGFEADLQRMHPILSGATGVSLLQRCQQVCLQRYVFSLGPHSLACCGNAAFCHSSQLFRALLWGGCFYLAQQPGNVNVQPSLGTVADLQLVSRLAVYSLLILLNDP